MKHIIKFLLRENLNNIADFEEALDNLTTLDLEDDQVRIPEFNEDTDTYIFQIYKHYVHIRKKDELPSSGPFELFILNVNDDVIGFLRGTKNPTTISFNLVYLNEDNRGWGIATDIYEYFLNKGYIIKSDSEITQATQGLYLKLVNMGYKPLVFDDQKVGLKK
jgi:hypothetical protein